MPPPPPNNIPPKPQGLSNHNSQTYDHVYAISGEVGQSWGARPEYLNGRRTEFKILSMSRDDLANILNE